MTTKVVIAAPDNSTHDLALYIEDKTNGSWNRRGAPILVPPRTTAEPIYVTGSVRVVVEEVERSQPKD